MFMAKSKTSVMVFTAKWAVVASWVARKLAESGVEVVEVDVDENFAEAEKWRVLCVPTVVVVQDGRETKRLIGREALGAAGAVKGRR